jgi:hypothetical protein
VADAAAPRDPRGDCLSTPVDRAGGGSSLRFRAWRITAASRDFTRLPTWPPTAWTQTRKRVCLSRSPACRPRPWRSTCPAAAPRPRAGSAPSSRSSTTPSPWTYVNPRTTSTASGPPPSAPMTSPTRSTTSRQSTPIRPQPTAATPNRKSHENAHYRPPRTAAAHAARRRKTETAIERIRQSIARLRREKAQVSVAAVARRAEVSRTFLYDNVEARAMVAAAITAAGERRIQLLADQDDAARRPGASGPSTPRRPSNSASVLEPGRRRRPGSTRNIIDTKRCQDRLSLQWKEGSPPWLRSAPVESAR